MLKLLTTTAMLTLLPALALAAESDKAGKSEPAAAQGYDKKVPPPATEKGVKTYPPVMGKTLDDLRAKLEREHKEKEDARMGKFDAPLGPGQTLAPGQDSVQPVVAAPLPPQPSGPPEGAMLPTVGSTPKGWVECSQTHAAKVCGELAKTTTMPDGAKWIIKLPEGGDVAALNAFLDKVAASKAEQ